MIPVNISRSHGGVYVFLTGACPTYSILEMHVYGLWEEVRVLSSMASGIDFQSAFWFKIVQTSGGNIHKYDFVTAALKQLTSTSIHSLSFLQVADMVSVVPNSKYQSLFFILQSQREKQRSDRFYLTPKLALRNRASVSTESFQRDCVWVNWIHIEVVQPWVLFHFQSNTCWQLVVTSP